MFITLPSIVHISGNVNSLVVYFVILEYKDWYDSRKVTVIDIGMRICIFFIVIAAIDWKYRKWKFHEDMKMTKQPSGITLVVSVHLHQHCGKASLLMVYSQLSLYHFPSQHLLSLLQGISCLQAMPAML